MSTWRSTLFPGRRGRDERLALWRTGLKTGAMTAPATGLGFGVKRVVEGDLRARQRALEGDGAEVVLRHARQGQRALRLEAKAAVIVRIAQHHAACGAAFLQLGQQLADKPAADPWP